jgi:hypothetical protein
MNPYVHDLTIRRVAFDDSPGSRDEAGQPSRSVTTAAVRGLVQPRQLDEIDDTRSAGSVVSDHVIFLPLGTDIAHEDAVDWGERRLEVVGVRSFEFGRLAHLEVDARMVTTAGSDEDGS